MGYMKVLWYILAPLFIKRVILAMTKQERQTLAATYNVTILLFIHIQLHLTFML